MAVTYGFFNSVNHDRVYNADQMSTYFKGLVTPGVFRGIGGAFQVTADTGMNVQVQSGRALIGADYLKWVDSNAPVVVPITAAHVSLNRYSAVILELDLSNRNITVKSIDGTPASTPTKPAITNTGSIYQLCLAYVYVAAGASSITAANIEDSRADDTVCGWVSGLIAGEGAGIHSYRKLVTFQVGDGNVINLDMTNYTYESSDLFLVYFNGLKALETVDYTVNGSGSPATLTCNMAVQVGDTVEIIVLK